MQNKKKVVKTIVGQIAAATTSRVVYQIVYNNTEPTGINKIMIPIGTLFISALVSRPAKALAEAMVDDIFSYFPDTDPPQL